MPPLHETGKWDLLVDQNDLPIDSNVTAIHASLLPEGKVLYFHARYAGHSANYTSYLFDPIDNSMSERIITVWSMFDSDGIQPSALFCSGHTFLADGKLLVAGGERTRPPVSFRGIKYSYKWNGTSLVPESKMSKGRWYPQLTRIPNGKVVAMSGYKFESQTIEQSPEIYDPATGQWTLFSDADETIPLYNGAYVIPFGVFAGQIFYDLVAWGGAMSQGKRFNPNEGDIQRWDVYGGTGTARAHGNSCMLPIRNSDQNAFIVNIGSGNMKASIISIGNNLNPQWIDTNADMHHMRHDSPNFLLLADGTPVVFGGDNTNYPEKLNYSDPNPQNWTWTEIDAEATVPRKYHSTALLLPDGRVWTAGSRLFNPNRNEYEDDMERRIEFYSPGYLFDGSRPSIENVPSIINYGTQFDLSYSDLSIPEIDSVVLISLPSVTHCFDANQKFIYLDFFSLGLPGTVTVSPPANANIAQPGPYMLFILKAKSQSISGTNRIPSIAKIVSLQ
jgi:hypothetical protein